MRAIHPDSNGWVVRQLMKYTGSGILQKVLWPVVTKGSSQSFGDSLILGRLRFFTECRPAGVSMESLILAQDERWRRA